MSVVIVVHGQSELLQLIAALKPPRRFTRLLHRWQQQPNQYSNNGNDHQQFYESKTSAGLGTIL
nr:hypothetical protein [Rosistilla ulvae]